MDADSSSFSIQQQRKSNVAFYKGVVTDLESRIKNHASCIEDLNFIIIKLTQEKSNVENINKGLEDLLHKERTKQRSHIKALRDEIHKMTEGKAFLERVIGEQSEKYKQVTQEIKDLEREREASAAKIKRLKEKLAKLKAEKEALLKQLMQERELTLAKQSQDKEEIQMKLKKLEEEIDDFHTEKQLLKEGQAKLTADIQTLKEKEKEHEKEMEKVETKLEELKIKCEVTATELKKEQETTQKQKGALENLLRSKTEELTSPRSTFDEDLVKKIRYIFVSYVHPDNVLHMFHHFDINVLSQPDIERVRAFTENHGPHGGAVELLNVLPRYKDWFPCLMKVLRHPDVKQEHVAKLMQEALDNKTVSPSRDVPHEDDTSTEEDTELKLTASSCDNPPRGPDTSQRDHESSDSQTLLKVASPVQDLHELEFSNADETLLSEKKRCCTKNPGHSSFISMPNLSLSLLPENWRDEKVLDYIKVAAKLTVRCAVSFTSKHRAVRYVLLGQEGAHLLTRYGSGIVWDVSRPFTTYDGHTCPCKSCERSPSNARTHWGEFHIETCKYIVYNNEESVHTTCRIFYDDDDIKDAGADLVGVGVAESWADKDYCRVVCITHDEELSKRIERDVDNFWLYRKELKSKSPLKPWTVRRVLLYLTSMV